MAVALLLPAEEGKPRGSCNQQGKTHLPVLPGFMWVDSGGKPDIPGSSVMKSLSGAPAGGILAHRPCIPGARESQACQGLAEPTPKGLGLDRLGARASICGAMAEDKPVFIHFTHWKPGRPLIPGHPQITRKDQIESQA